MKLIIDIPVLGIVENSMPQHALFEDPTNQVILKWPTLLKYLNLDVGALFTTLPFEESQPLFQTALATLVNHEKKEDLFELYDLLFAEILTGVKNLPQLQPQVLLHALMESKIKPSFEMTLHSYEKALREDASKTLHDLILYLGWEHMCVCLSRLLDYQSQDPQFIAALQILKECLIESYQHIMHQGRTTPSIYRLFEALFFYEMREERIDTHLAEEWTILSQSFPLIKDQHSPADCFYIDDAVVSVDLPKEITEFSDCYATLDSQVQIDARFAFALCLMNKIKKEVPNWNYMLQKPQIISLHES